MKKRSGFIWVMFYILIGSLLIACGNEPPPPAPGTFEYTVLVKDWESNAIINNAQVTLNLKGLAPYTGATDTLGIAVFTIGDAHKGESAALVFDAPNYEPKTINVGIGPAAQTVFLQASSAETISTPVDPIANVTNTPTSSTATSVPPTATSVPPTNTSVPPTNTPVPPTATSVPPTNTPVPPTATSVPPTNTPAVEINTTSAVRLSTEWFYVQIVAESNAYAGASDANPALGRVQREEVYAVSDTARTPDMIAWYRITLSNGNYAWVNGCDAEVTEVNVEDKVPAEPCRAPAAVTIGSGGSSGGGGCTLTHVFDLVNDRVTVNWTVPENSQYIRLTVISLDPGKDPVKSNEYIDKAQSSNVMTIEQFERQDIPLGSNIQAKVVAYNANDNPMCEAVTEFVLRKE